MTSAQNWAGNVLYRAERIATPQSLGELTQLVQQQSQLRALGSRHSFTDIADTDGVLVSLAEMSSRVEVNDQTARASAGLRYGDLVAPLATHGKALANLASLPHISVGGAVQTGTHGSGNRVGSLATQVAAFEMVTGRGDHVRVVRGDPHFDGAVVALGSLGVLTHLELDVEPAYDVAQFVWDGGDWNAIVSAFDDVTAAGDSVSLFTTWKSADVVDTIWVKKRVGAAAHLAEIAAPGAFEMSAVGARAADGPRHPIPGIDPAPANDQGGVPGPWHDRLPHFRLAFTPSVGAEIQTEYIVDRRDAGATIEALRALSGRIAPLLYVCEVRTVARDDLWLSGAYGRDSVCVHFTWCPHESAVRALLPDIEAALPPSARPHWGKVFTMDAAEVRERYERWGDFMELVDHYDPERKFDNAFLSRMRG